MTARTPISPVATREDLIAMIHNRDALVSDLKTVVISLRAQLAKANDPTRDDTSSDLDIDLPKARPMGQS